MLGLSPKKLRSFVSDYAPTAVGIKNRGRWGWICFQDLQTLRKLVQETDGKEAPNGKIWTVIDDYDGSVTEACTISEAHERKKIAQQANTESKQEERRAWRAKRDEDSLESSMMGLNFGEDEAQDSEGAEVDDWIIVMTASGDMSRKSV